MRGIVEDAIDRRLILVGGFASDHPARIAVPVETRKITARNFQPDTVAR
jgi:hypothetical protein